MFRDIKVEKQNDLAYGTTQISNEDTLSDIRKLLRKHKCDEILIGEKGGDQFIAFKYQGNPYVFRVPKVSVKRGRGYQRKYEYDDRLGVRIVYRFLQTLLDLTKVRIVDMQTLLLGARMVDVNGKSVPLSDVVDRIPAKELLPDGYLPAAVDEQGGPPEDRKVIDIDPR